MPTVLYPESSVAISTPEMPSTEPLLTPELSPAPLPSYTVKPSLTTDGKIICITTIDGAFEGNKIRVSIKAE